MSIITGIRNSNSLDLHDIASIHVTCWQEVYAFMPSDVLAARGHQYRIEQWRKWFSDRPTDQALFSLLSAEKVVGFAVAKRNNDQAIDAVGEFHACYILPKFRGGISGPIAMLALAKFLYETDQWPACVWAFRSNPYRRIYSALGCVPTVFRDRIIEGHALPEIGYLAPPYEVLISRLNRMYASAVQRQTQSLQSQHRHLRLRG